MITLLIKSNAGLITEHVLCKVTPFTSSKYFIKGWQVWGTPGLGILRRLLSSTACNCVTNCYWYVDSPTPYNYIGFQALQFLQDSLTEFNHLMTKVIFIYILSLYYIGLLNLIYDWCLQFGLCGNTRLKFK